MKVNDLRKTKMGNINKNVSGIKWTFTKEINKEKYFNCDTKYFISEESSLKILV